MCSQGCTWGARFEFRVAIQQSAQAVGHSTRASSTVRVPARCPHADSVARFVSDRGRLGRRLVSVFNESMSLFLYCHFCITAVKDMQHAHTCTLARNRILLRSSWHARPDNSLVLLVQAHYLPSVQHLLIALAIITGAGGRS